MSMWTCVIAMSIGVTAMTTVTGIPIEAIAQRIVNETLTGVTGTLIGKEILIDATGTRTATGPRIGIAMADKAINPEPRTGRVNDRLPAGLIGRLQVERPKIAGIAM